MKPKCILFAGPPGSSKTPVAIYLSWNTGLPIFNNDAIRREVAEDTKRAICSEDPEFLKRQSSRINKLFQSQRSFIFDRSIDRTWGKTKKLINENDYEYFLISFDLSDKLIEKNGKAKGYPNDNQNKVWYEEHKNFVKKQFDQIDLTINDGNFEKRLKISLKAVNNFLKN